MCSAKKSRGRQKVEMKKMSNESNLQVTFSKRRSGLFKKASELCTLCGADIALVVFSPGDKVFSFGHPSVDAVIDRYLTRAPQPLNSGSGTMQFIDAHRMNNVRELNAQLTQVNNQLEAERKRAEELNRQKKEMEKDMWWARNVEQLSTNQLNQYKTGLENLRTLVAQHVEKLVYTSVGVGIPNHLAASSFSGPNNLHMIQPPPPPPMPMPMLQNFMFSDGNIINYPAGPPPPGYDNMGMGRGGYGPPPPGAFF